MSEPVPEREPGAPPTPEREPEPSPTPLGEPPPEAPPRRDPESDIPLRRRGEAAVPHTPPAAVPPLQKSGGGDIDLNAMLSQLHGAKPDAPLSIHQSLDEMFDSRRSDVTRQADGFRMVEVLQNCVIFADKVHENYYGRATKSDTLLYLKHGEPLRYGKEMEVVQGPGSN